MSPEKNVVEAARAVVATRGWDLLGGSHEKIVALRAAISAYDSAPAPSEDRVREAAEAAVDAWWGKGAFRQCGVSGRERAIEAIRRYVTPAPALPAGTVAVPVSEIEYLRDTVSSFGVGVPDWVRAAREAADAITKRLPPPRPEPPKELVAEWERKALEYAKAQPNCHESIWPTLTKCYVAALRAAWDEKGGA